MQRRTPRLLWATALIAPLLLIPAVSSPLLALAAAISSALGISLAAWPGIVARLALVAPLFARLRKDRLLDEGVRPRIVSLLGTEPGLGIVDIRDRLSIGWGTAVHHLELLESAGLVVSQHSGRRRRFFLPSDSFARRTAVSVLSVEPNRRMLDFLRENPNSAQHEICAALDVSPPVAHKYLARLAASGLVVAQRDGREVRYAVTAPYGDAHMERSRMVTLRPEGPSALEGHSLQSPLRVTNDGVNTAGTEG